MTTLENRAAVSSAVAEDARTMAQYHIQRVPVDVYHYNGYRYSSLKDAVEYAKREQQKASASPQ